MDGCPFTGVRLLDNIMEGSHLAMSSSLRGIDGMDYVHAQTRGPNWVQLVVNQDIYHLPIPYPQAVTANTTTTTSSSPNIVSSTTTSSSTNGFAGIEVEPVEGSQEAPEWIPITSLLSTRLKWKTGHDNVLFASFVMKRSPSTTATTKKGKKK
jgi:hypothetical protein